MIITETPRLLLREFTSDDVGALADILRDPQVMEFSSNGPYTEEETWHFNELINCLAMIRRESFQLIAYFFLCGAGGYQSVKFLEWHYSNRKEI